jgi:predicted O-methyltransferase YrrM
MSVHAIATIFRAKWNAFYALWIYLPYSLLARSYRAQSRAVRGVKNPHQQKTRLPQSLWPFLITPKPIRLVEIQKVKGNVRVSELAILAKAATTVPPDRQIVEIGTFDGRTTLNLAVNSAPGTPVITLDLPKDYAPKFPMNIGEYKLANKPISGLRYRSCNLTWPEPVSRILQLLGDSATFDWTPYYGQAGLVFVDGSHTYENVVNDSEVAFRLVAPGGIIIWHDYGVWEEVTRTLDELAAAQGLGLRHIFGTSLVFWRRTKTNSGTSQPDDQLHERSKAVSPSVSTR